MTDDDASVAGSITGLQVTSKSLMNEVAQERVLNFLESRPDVKGRVEILKKV